MKAKAVANLLNGVGGLVGLLLSTGAVAVPYTNTSGAICKNLDAPDASYIDYLPAGVRSLKSAATSIICPLSRDTMSSKGAVGYVDVYHSVSATTACTLYSYSKDASSRLGLYSQTWTGAGFHEFKLLLNANGKSGPHSSYVMVCIIPQSQRGKIMGVDLWEQ
ncbi:hypothetical protein [uncultured Thiodictyon sp.]|jgi:hypothetical protein|uniref:hypothetical protein n=1 Tax=uncultured Thiodictyon sp. TaxID=1846217 RepID=UPI0025E81F92|nr:hypothetical protein [uncultured Thiodictyon sp.]